MNNDTRGTSERTNQEGEEMDIHTEQLHRGSDWNDQATDGYDIGLSDYWERASSLDGDTSFTGLFGDEETNDRESIEEINARLNSTHLGERLSRSEYLLLHERWQYYLLREGDDSGEEDRLGIYEGNDSVWGYGN